MLHSPLYILFNLVSFVRNWRQLANVSNEACVCTYMYSKKKEVFQCFNVALVLCHLFHTK